MSVAKIAVLVGCLEGVDGVVEDAFEFLENDVAGFAQSVLLDRGLHVQAQKILNVTAWAEVLGDFKFLLREELRRNSLKLD